MAGRVNKASPTTVRAIERELRCIELRSQGMTFEEIAQQLGMERSGAYRAMLRALKKARRQTSEVAEAYRDAELERLDERELKLEQYEARLAGKLDRCEESGELIACITVLLRVIDSQLKILDRRANYLGLYFRDRKPLDDEGHRVAGKTLEEARQELFDRIMKRIQLRD